MRGVLGRVTAGGGVKGTLAAVAIVSIPVAAVLGIGFGTRALIRKFRRPETDEEKLARLQRAAYRNDISGDR